MQKIYMVLFLLFPTVLNAQWVKQNSGTGAALNDIFVSSDGLTAWTIGQFGTIRKTSNGGTTWNAQASGGVYAISSVFFLSDNLTGWASVNANKILKTTDGGVTWDNSIPTTVFPKKVRFLNSMVGIAVGVGGIDYSLNGGTSWQHDNCLDSLTIQDITLTNYPQVAYAIGIKDADVGYVIKLTFNGSNWQPNILKKMTGLRSISYTSEGVLFVGSLNGGLVMKSKDEFNTYETLGNLDWGVWGLKAISESVIFVASDAASVYKTEDGHNFTWDKSPSEQINALYVLRAVEFVNNQIGYVVGDGGSILKYAGVLPILLSSFTAQTQNKKVLLNWSTGMEQNNKGFALMRKAIAGNDWQQVGYISSKGNSNQSQSYSFADEPKGGTAFLYQLKQTDIDGKFTFSNIVKAKLEVDKVELSTYPNPAHGATTIL